MMFFYLESEQVQIHNIISYIKYEEFLVMQNTCISFIHCQEKYNYPTARIPLQNILVNLD